MLYRRPMGTFRYPALVAHPRGTAAPVEVKFLVDTRAMFTCLPTLVPASVPMARAILDIGR